MTTIMKRFAVAALLLGVTCFGDAQQPRLAKIGVLNADATSALFRERLCELGYVEGRDVAFEVRNATEPKALRALAAELVARDVNVIVASGTLATRAAMQQTSTIPIVM